MKRTDSRRVWRNKHPKAAVNEMRKLEAERIADLRQLIWSELAGRPDPADPASSAHIRCRKSAMRSPQAVYVGLRCQVELQGEFALFLGLLHRVAEIGAVTVVNVLQDDSRTDLTTRSEIASRRKFAEAISLLRVVLRIQTLAS
jgi:hypothetical protein